LYGDIICNDVIQCPLSPVLVENLSFNRILKSAHNMKTMINGWCDGGAEEMIQMLEDALLTIRGGAEGGETTRKMPSPCTGEWWIGVVKSPNDESSGTRGQPA